MIINTAPGGGGSKTDLNLFCQPDEPVIKEGLWIKTSTKQSINNIINKSSYVIGGTWRASNAIPNFPYFNSSIIESAAYLKNKIFYLVRQSGADSNGSLPTYIAIYDFSTKTYTTKSGPTLQGGNASGMGAVYKGGFLTSDGVSIIGYVYGIGANGLYVTRKKIVVNPDTLEITVSDTSLQLEINVKFGAAAGKYYTGFTTDEGLTVYSVDLSTFISTQEYLLDEGHTSYFYYAVGCVYNNKLYFAICPYYPSSYTTTLRIYDFATHTVTTRTSNYSFWVQPYSLMVAYQGSIYMSRGTNSSPATTPELFSYSISTGTFALLPGAPLSIYQLFAIGTHLVGTSYSTSTPVQCYDFISESLTSNALTLLDGINYKIALIKSGKISSLYSFFNNAWWYDADFEEYPTYIGNGAAFIKIKN